MAKKRQVGILIILITIFFAINYSSIDSFLKDFLDESKTAIVSRVIDGDTLEITDKGNRESVRLLGINTPERGEVLYDEAKRFLEELSLNKSVRLEFGKDRYDRYNRTLAYIFVNEFNINKEIVRQGYANIYFPSGKDVYYNEFLEAWKECINRDINLCEKSKDECANCVILKDLDVKNQKVIFENKCGFDCDLNKWTIKDEGRKKFIFGNFILRENENVEVIIGNGKNTSKTLYWKGYEYVWTETGDSIFLRDEKNKLVLYKNY